MADPLIWSKLPEHLVPYIIEQAQDLKTLKNWCEATKGTWHLNRVATRLRWKTFTINKKNMHMGDLVDLSDYFTAKRMKDRAVNNEVSQAIRGTDERPGYGVIPATFIKRLLVNMQTGWGIDYMKDTLATVGVLLTLEVLDQNSCLEEIEHFGFLCQDQLDRFVKIPTLTKIELRKTHGCTRGLYENLKPVSVEDYLEIKGINLAKLFCLSKLTSLNVSQLRSVEAPGLAKAVRSLPQLQHLRISEMSDTIHRGRGSRAWPMAIFLRELYSESLPASSMSVASDISSDFSDSNDLGYLKFVQGTKSGLPASLQSLELVDNTEMVLGGDSILNFLGDDSLEAEWMFLREGTQQPLAHLTSLYLDNKYKTVIVDILQKIAPINLNHLAISTFTEHAIYDQLPSLQHMILLNAWEQSDLFIYDRFPHLLQVYLAEPPPIHCDEFKQADYIQSVWVKNLSIRIFGHNPQPPNWGPEVRHLRVDQIDPEILRVDSIDSDKQGLKKLRVMVLRPPRVFTDGPWIWSLETEPYHKEPFGPRLPDSDAMMQLPEWILASQLAAQDLPELRLIAVGKYRFWVQRPKKKQKAKSKTKPKEKPESKLWFLRHALEDPTEEKKVLVWATKRDWEFFGDKETRLTAQAAAEERRGGSRVVLFKKVVGWGE